MTRSPTQSTSSCALPQPITLGSLVPGQQYFCISLDRGGNLCLEESIIFIGKHFTEHHPKKGERPYTIKWKSRLDEVELQKRLLHLCGIIPEKRFDFQRTFIWSSTNIYEARELIRTNDFDAYLETIGEISLKEHQLLPEIRQRRTRSRVFRQARDSLLGDTLGNHNNHRFS